MTPEQIDKLAVEIAGKLNKDLTVASDIIDDATAVVFARRLVAEIQARNEPVAQLDEDRKGVGAIFWLIPIKEIHDGMKLYTFPPDCEELRKDAERYKAAWVAACGFIDSHVADPDLTLDMVEKYAVFLQYRDSIAKGTAK